MTFPITPLGSIHVDPFAAQEAQLQLQAAWNTFQAIFSQLPAQIITAVVNAILTAFGLQAFEGDYDALIAQLNTAMQAIPGDVITGYTAIEQEILDAIANALGHSGTGHTPTQVLGYLEAIPGSVISGVTTIEQETLDAIANALGHSGTGHTPSDILGYLANIPKSVVTGLTGNLGNLDATGIYDALAGFNNQATSLFKYLTPTGGNIGQFNAAQLQGALNSAVTYGGTALTTFFGNINSSGNLLAAGVTGALNTTAVTVGGVTLGTLFTNINSSGLLLASGITGALGTGLTVAGTTLGTLFTNINSSGNLLASGLTGAINVAATVAGTAIGTLTSNINSSGQFAGSAITGSIDAALISGITTTEQAFQDAINQALRPLATAGATASQVEANVQTALQGLLPAIVQNTNGTATSLTSAITMNANGTASYVSNGVHTLIDNANGTMSTVSAAFQSAAAAAITQAGNNLTAAAVAGQQVLNTLFGGFGGFGATGATPAQANSAVSNAQQNISSNAVGLAALNAVLQAAASGGGTAVAVNLSTYPDGALPGIFTDLAGGSSSVTSGIASGAGEYNVITTQTDRQIISGVFSSGSGVAYLFGRLNVAGTSSVQVTYGSPRWVFSYNVSGTNTAFGIFATDTLTAGAVYSLVCGNSGGDRVYQLLKNGTPLILSNGLTSFTEVGTGSQLGASYRSGGWGALAGTGLSTFTMVDNAPAAAVGSGFRVYRASTGTGAFTSISTSGSWGIAKLPATWFDATPQYQTADFAGGWNPSTNTLTIGVSGWYAVEVGLQFSMAGTTSTGVGFYKNGAWGGRVGTIIAWPSGSTPTFSNMFAVYCAAGDTLTPGMFYATGANHSPTNSDSTGQNNYFSVSFMNRGTLS